MFTPSRAAGLRRLESFLPRAGRDYQRDRNSDLGPTRRDNVSVLSPWIRYRLLTEREVAAAVLGRHSQSASEKFIQEVLWRTYWKGWLELRPAVWRNFQAELARARRQVDENSGLSRALQEAEQGRTGIEGFDDWARELVDTGYLHNHARMWFASIWIFTLRLPWTLGADFFLRHLLDADAAANTLSWRWVAGLQTVGKTYLATADNIARYTDGRFRPRGLATSAEALTEPGPLPAPRRLPPAPDPERFDTSDALLLVTAEDLHPESLFPAGVEPAAIVVCSGGAQAVDWPWGERAGNFVSAALDDTAGRLQADGRAPVQRIKATDSAALVDLVRGLGVSRIVTAYAPVGPVADQLASLAGELDRQGLTLECPRRAWDTRAWPHATRGFFPFKERIPALLRDAGLAAG